MYLRYLILQLYEESEVRMSAITKARTILVLQSPPWTLGMDHEPDLESVYTHDIPNANKRPHLQAHISETETGNQHHVEFYLNIRAI